MNAKILFLVTVLALATKAFAKEKKVICYFGSWSVYRPGDGKFDIDLINPRLCTHLIYTFVGITTDGDVKVLDSWQDLPDNYGKDGFGRFNKLREQNPKAKTLVAIGGWNEGSTKYSQVVSNPTIRRRFVNNVVEFVKKHKFDGFDVDWEYPNQRGGVPSDKQNFVLLLKELRQEFDKYGFILSAAVGAAESSASQSYDIPGMSKYLHFINLMSYDFNGAWSKSTGINAPLYPSKSESGNQAKLNVDAAVNYWLRNGAPAEKLIVGVPLYGRVFTLANPSNNGIGAPATGPGTAGPFTREPGMLGYNEICEFIRQGGWTVVRQNEMRVPYAFKGNQWLGFDDTTSVREKANYIKAKGLGGAMVWSIETDDFRGKCGVKYPLLRILNEVLRNGVPVPTDAPVPNPPVTQPPGTTPGQPTPPHKVCKKEGYVRDKNDCSKFYYCHRAGNTFEVSSFNCPDGLVFDENINGCNYRSAVPGC